MTYIADARFSELIQQLEEAHMFEVRSLRLENQKLRAMNPSGVQDVDQNSCIVDIDCPSLSVGHLNSTETGEKRSSLEDVLRKREMYIRERAESDLSEKRCKLTNSNSSGRSSQRLGSWDGISPNGRPSLLQSLSSKRFGEYEKRAHWEEVPESAQAAWEQGTTFDELEEHTANAMLALTKVSFLDMSNSVLVRSSSFARRGASRKISRSIAPRRSSFHPISRICSAGVPMVDPATTRRVTWDFIAALLIVYDLVTIPLLVFDPKENVFTDFMGWCCLIFWTLDIFASCCTGIYIDGQLVLSRKTVISRYLKTWFILDCIAVVPDWILKILLGSAQDLGRLGGMVRLARGTRVLRLLRLAKLKKLMNEFYDMISNEYMFIVVDLVKLLTIILVLNHIVACLWYLVGYISRQTGAATNWLEDVGQSPVYEGPLAWKYSTCLHWSITQFTAASLDIFATNTGERIFSVLIIFWGLVGLSSFVGSVTTTITALRNMSNDHQKQFWLLRKYLSQRRISHNLTVRILRYLEFKAAARKNILPASKVLLLSQLSEQLSSQLKKEANNSILDVHPFFSVLGRHMTSYMDRVCDQALKGLEYAEDDIVFSAAQEAGGMSFVKAGGFRYSENIELQGTTFISEPALWTSWCHRENLVAIGDINEIISILHEPFGEVLCMHPQPWNFAQNYATDFVKALNDHDPATLSDISMNDFVKKLNDGQHLIQITSLSSHGSSDSAAFCTQGDWSPSPSRT